MQTPENLGPFAAVPRPRNRAGLYFRIDLVLTLAGVLVFTTGLVLLLRFHVGWGALENEAFGISRLFWLNTHRAAGAVLAAAVSAHAWCHRRTILAVLGEPFRRLPGRPSRSWDVLYYATFATVLATGSAAWFILAGSTPWAGPVLLGPLSPQRHPWIDVHNIAGLFACGLAVQHMVYRWRLMLRMGQAGSPRG